MTTLASEQSFGANPKSVRDTDHYTNEYVGSFVDKWDALIDWDSRAKSEGNFFIDQLKERGARKVLDVATGTGFHSVRLLEAGFEVVSADGSAEMLARAFENGRNRGHILRTVLADWRWLNRDVHGEYDAIICLGNSFTHLFSERDRRKALAEFYAMLKHDGILMLDQRNYDAILDHGFSSKHAYYYCGEDVRAEPEYMDEGLARFQYSFRDGSNFHLNMFPLRRDYTTRLMREVGFQHIDTYGDFKQTYRETDPDFYIHVAEKYYEAKRTKRPSAMTDYSDTVETARAYYNSGDADNFYHTIWGGEDIHIGLYESDEDTIHEASHRTVKHMASLPTNLGRNARVLDVGAGYGGAARHLARKVGCKVDALNLSEAENERNREMTGQAGLDHLVEVVDGSFENLPYQKGTFDLVWSQDAILHSGQREKVLEEIARVLKPGGELIFTDPMQADDAPADKLKPILDRIHLDTLGSPGFYRSKLGELGFREVSFEDMTEQLVNHYSRVLTETRARRAELEKVVSSDYLDRMERGLEHWVEGGRQGHLVWGVFLFQVK